jgi:hypothetical protein
VRHTGITGDKQPRRGDERNQLGNARPSGQVIFGRQPCGGGDLTRPGPVGLDSGKKDLLVTFPHCADYGTPVAQRPVLHRLRRRDMHHYMSIPASRGRGQADVVRIAASPEAVSDEAAPAADLVFRLIPRGSGEVDRGAPERHKAAAGCQPFPCPQVAFRTASVQVEHDVADGRISKRAKVFRVVGRSNVDDIIDDSPHEGRQYHRCGQDQVVVGKHRADGSQRGQGHEEVPEAGRAHG